MNANLIYGNELKPYTIKRLMGYSDNEEGKQVKTYQNIEVDLAVYDKGSKLVKKVGGEESYPISTVHIYCDLNVLSHHDIVPFKDKEFTILEAKTAIDYTFAKGVSEDV